MNDDEPTGGANDRELPRDFGSRVAHEIRGPLNLVAGALSEIDGTLDESKTKLLELAGRGVAKLGRLADRLSLLSRIETDSLQIGRAPTDLRTIAQGATERARQLMGRRRIDVTISGDPVAPIVADAGLVAMATQELVENALRHARSTVDVRVHSVEQLARVEVVDDGRGVSNEEAAHLFVRHGSGAPRGGLHIGLSLAQAIARAHDGRIVLESSVPGERTCFVLQLPARMGRG
jgi:signal transduction histidine kinase